MKILHITNDYSGSSVYKNLVCHIDRQGVQQIVYHPMRTESNKYKNSIDFEVSDSEIQYRHILDVQDRVFYRRKIEKILEDIIEQIDMYSVDVIHAHTWYSDGGVAYLLSQKYNIPYIVTVRNTDLNLFLKYRLFDRKFGRRILENAKKIILITKIYQDRMLRDGRLSKVRNCIINNSVVIPNGVDPYWIENKKAKERTILGKNIVNLLYVGKFTKGKNVANLIDAVDSLNQLSRKFQYKLRLVGGGGNDVARVIKKANQSSNIEILGQIDDKRDLMRIFRDTEIFTMPSRSETFGLVYIESLLQGVPIVYTAGEGIDGFYDDFTIGEKVANVNVAEIADKISAIAENYINYNFDVNEIAINHNWESIAQKYINIYTAE